jgi:hypothetical protein
MSPRSLKNRCFTHEGYRRMLGRHLLNLAEAGFLFYDSNKRYRGLAHGSLVDCWTRMFCHNYVVDPIQIK